MSELYICIDCEVANAITDPTELNQDHTCKRCGSTSVVEYKLLESLALAKRKASLDDALRETSTGEANRRWLAMKEQRSRDHEPLRAFLRSRFYSITAGGASELCSGETPSVEVAVALNKELESVLAEWDGWAYYVYYPWESRSDEELNPIPGSFTIVLTQGTKNPTKWAIVLDSNLHEVRRLT